MLEDTIQDVVERIDRHADRYRNAGDATGEQRALAAAARAASARNLYEALGIETALVGISFAGPAGLPKKKSWWQRLFGGGSGSGSSGSSWDNDDS